MNLISRKQPRLNLLVKLLVDILYIRMMVLMDGFRVEDKEHRYKGEVRNRQNRR